LFKITVFLLSQNPSSISVHLTNRSQYYTTNDGTVSVYQHKYSLLNTDDRWFCWEGLWQSGCKILKLSKAKMELTTDNVTSPLCWLAYLWQWRRQVVRWWCVEVATHRGHGKLFTAWIAALLSLHRNKIWHFTNLLYT